MIKLENNCCEDFNSKIPNELSSIQVHRINRLLQETIETYPTDIGNSQLNSNKFSEILNKYGKTIYFCLKPFEIQKSKLYECIDRLNKIINITQNQKSNFYEKLEKIENSEKKCIIEMLMEHQQNQNADQIQMERSNRSVKSGNKRVVDKSLKQNDMRKNDGNDSMERSQNFSILRQRHFGEANQIKTKNLINQKFIERSPSRKDEISVSNKFDLNKRGNIITKKEYSNAEKISFNKTDSGTNFESFSSQRTSPKFGFLQPRIQDKSYQSDDRKSRMLTKTPLERIRNLSLKIETPVQKTKSNPKNFDKQDTEWSSSVSSEIKTPKIIILKNENLLKNTKFDESSQINQRNEFDDDDLIQKILAKFDSVKQFIEKYRKQQKRQEDMNNYNDNNDCKRNVKYQFVTEWISANKNVDNKISNLQLKSTKSSSISQLRHSVSPRPLSDNANILKQIEENSINIVVDVEKN